MSIATTGVRLAFDALYWSGVSGLTRRLTQGLGVIFCMHRVRPKTSNAFAPNANLEVTPEFLDAAIGMLKVSGYDLVTMDEVAHRLAVGQQGKRPFAAFTLDDGYRDNLEHALPVFERHECPFAVYVAPGFVDGTSELWWLGLEEIIARQDRLEGTIAGVQFNFETRTSQQKQLAWQRLVGLYTNLSEYEQKDWIRASAAKYGVDLRRQCSEEIMTWGEICMMAKHRLATIGAHTLNHHALRRLSADDAAREITQSKTRLEKELKMSVRHFAYPYGNRPHAGPRDFALAAEAGFTTSVTTRLGTVFSQHAGNMQALPRVMISGKYKKPRWLKVLASGLPGLARNMGSRLNVGD